MSYLRFGLFSFLLLAAVPVVKSQPGRIDAVANGIYTVRMAVDGDVAALPVLHLGGNEVLEVSFDELTHEYRRYTYRIEHCDADGEPTSELFENDYVQSTQEAVVIDDYTPSTNTTVLYTHYRFSLPNVDMRPLLSGNYRIIVEAENDDGEHGVVFVAYFAVLDMKASLRASCTTNTDIDYNQSHQQLSLRLDLSNLPLRDPGSEVKVLVMQNRRLDNAVRSPKPTMQNGNILIWDHARELIFPAGNEYRKMEMLSTRYPGLHGDNVRWFDPLFHYTLMEDSPRRNYLYDEDRDGLSVVRWESSGDADTEADYVMTHFTLLSPRLQEKDVYLSGRWAVPEGSDKYKLTYNEQAGAYEGAVLLKTGYYNYLYLTSGQGSSYSGSTAEMEGNYFQTENEYSILAYYRPVGGRYWQLVASISPTYRPK